ncbi:MAG TPA: tyrosine-type recombinase/integrase, partial [Pontiella sp.]|nr:tyrosine-type recombinase/integrase [Pontiella sp.]
RTSEELAQAVHEARTGRRVDVFRLTDLPELWTSKPRNKVPSAKHAEHCEQILNGFIEWCTENAPAVKKLDHISPEHARAFMESHTDRGVSARTWNFILGTMKAACRRGGCTAFDEIRQRPQETVHRVPFSPEELADVLEAAKSEPLIYPLVVTAACTAMRKGDCCRLRWDAVDLQSGFITVKTSKTGRTVDIPLADLLRTEIEKQRGKKSKFVFPELEEQYRNDPLLLTRHFKRCLARAGFHDGNPPPQELKEYDPQELARKAEAHFRTITTEGKRDRAHGVFKHYITGKTLCQSADLVGVSKASASLYLNEIEQATGIAFIRGKKRKAAQTTENRGKTTQKRKTGILKASVRDFHALRTTWITLALMQGLPLELVQTVTGHATAEIVMQHYFKPHREQLKTALQKCMPALLTSSQTAPALDPNQTIQNAISALGTATAKNWKAVFNETMDILKSTAAQG